MSKRDVCKCMPRCISVCVLDTDPSKIICDGNVESLASLLPMLRLKQDKLDKLLAQALTKGKPGRRYQLARVLIENGANPDSMADNNKTPIHLAMERGLCDELEILLSHGADGTIRSPTPSLNSALHWTIRGLQNQRYTNENHGVACVELFLNNCKGVINETNCDGYTAVHLACMIRQWQIAKCLIQHGAIIDKEIKGTTARALIDLSDNTDLKILIKSIPIETIIPSPIELIEQLRNSLKNGNEDEFLNLIQNDYFKFKDIVNDPSDTHSTLLQLACGNEHTDAVKELIKAGADVNSNSKADIILPIVITVKKSNHKILKHLLESEKCDLSLLHIYDSQRTPLHIAVLEHDNLECFELLMDHASKCGLDINAQDFQQCTALHYAALKNKHEMVKILLSNKANIFIINNQNLPAFFNVRRNDIKEYLDNQISIKRAHNEEILIFNYEFIARDRSEKSRKSTPSTEEHIKLNTIEAGRVTSKPVNYEYIHTQLEMTPLEMFANSPEHKSLLNHPILRGFLNIKWNQIYWFIYLNFLFYLLFTATISYHVFSVISSNGTSLQSVENEMKEDSDTSWILSVILLILFASREIFQIVLSPSRYFLQYENWMEIVLIVLTAIMLTSNNVTDMKSLSAIVVLLMFTELVLLTGNLPLFSTYIIMFFKVLSSFAQLLLWYSLLIIGFGFSFYILFSKHDEGEDSDEFFSNIFVSLFKTIIMTTGEFESGDLKFGSVAVTSHIIFILFIFFVAIVLLNLLTGLAVSDTHAIRKEAELHFCISQARLYSQVEAVLLGGSYFVCPSLKRKIGSYVLVLSQLLTHNKVSSRNNFEIDIILNNGTMEPNLNGHCRNVMFCQCGQYCPFSNKICKWCLIFNTIVKDARVVVENREYSQSHHDIDLKLVMQKLEKLEIKTDNLETELKQNIQDNFNKLNGVLQKLASRNTI